jgi:hypothetical protein
MPFRLDFEADPEANVSRTFRCTLPAAQDVLLVLSFEGFWTKRTASALHSKPS